MSSEPETLAIAFLVESSLSVAQEWRKKVTEYASYVLKRLSESHPGCKPRVAFVTYATANTLPTPILCKRFFTELNLVFKEMEDLTKLGIGMTNSGGSKGMAALEGFVAALELFDILQNHLPPKEGSNTKSLVSHIIHIADTPPDASHCPYWNDSSALDNVSWDSLPVEMKKRNIQLSSINLQPNLPRFSELHAAVVSGGSTPWFKVQPPHTVLLAAFGTPAQVKVSPTKRPHDLNAEPDAKRPRLQPSTESPKPAVKLEPPQTQPVMPVSTATQPPRNVQPVISQPPSTSTNLPLAKTSQQKFMESLKSAGEHILQLEARIASAEVEGKTELVKSLTQEYMAKKETHTKITQAMAQQYLAAKQAAQAVPGQSQREVLAPQFGLNSGTTSMSTGNLPSAPSNLAPDIQIQHSRSLSETFPQSTIVPATNNAQPPISAQMQKMIEQHQHQQPTRPVHINPVEPLGGNPNQSIVSAATRPELPRFGAAAGPSQLPHQPENGNKNAIVWNGSLNWSGHGTAGKKDVRAYVSASTATPELCHSGTWPQALTLVPTREIDVTMADIQVWMKRNHPALCSFAAQPGMPDKSNEQNYKSLVQLLTMKKLFATAAWTTPAGEQTKNVLVFPVNNMGLAGAFFPLTGLPAELPKSISASLANISLPPHIATQMQNLNSEQRTALVNQLLRHRQHMMAQQQQPQPQPQFPHGQDGNGAVSFPPVTHASNHANMNTVLNMINSHGPGAPQPLHPNTMPRLGLNSEMLQSFVQRNAEGGNMNPQS